MLRVQDVDLTPNPQALKFIINERLLVKESRHYKDAAEAAGDPFAKGLFEIEGICSVFYMEKFVTIEKQPEADWGKIQRKLISFIEGFDRAMIPAEKDIPVLDHAQESELLKNINRFLDQRVRPALAGDGGGLEVLGMEGYTLTIRYQGACGSCPSSISGTLNAIENLLRREINPAIEVIPG